MNRRKAGHTGRTQTIGASDALADRRQDDERIQQPGDQRVRQNLASGPPGNRRSSAYA